MTPGYIVDMTTEPQRMVAISILAAMTISTISGVITMDKPLFPAWMNRMTLVDHYARARALIQLYRAGAVVGTSTWTPEIMEDINLWVDQQASKSALLPSVIITAKMVAVVITSSGNMRGIVTVPLMTVAWNTKTKTLEDRDSYITLVAHEAAKRTPAVIVTSSWMAFARLLIVLKTRTFLALT